MKCFGNPTKERVCYLCEKVDSKYYKKCVDEKRRMSDLYRRLSRIAEKCKHREQLWDEYTPYWGCSKDGPLHLRDSRCCSPSIDCEKYTTP